VQGTREPLHRPFVAWNQVDAISVAMRVPIRRNGSFLQIFSATHPQRGRLS